MVKMKKRYCNNIKDFKFLDDIIFVDDIYSRRIIEDNGLLNQLNVI